MNTYAGNGRFRGGSSISASERFFQKDPKKAQEHKLNLVAWLTEHATKDPDLIQCLSQIAGTNEWKSFSSTLSRFVR